MSGISNREMIKSAGIVPVKKMNDEYKFLILKTYNFVDFPKGRQEPGETLLQTAIREIGEETTIKPEELNFKWGIDSYTTEPYLKGKNKTTTYFVAETTRETIELPISLELGKPENDDWGWKSYKETKQLVNARIGKVIDWAWNKIKGA